MSWLYSLVVPSTDDVRIGMKQRLTHETQQLNAARKEMSKLAPAYNRFADLREEQIKREQRIERIIAVLGMDEYLKILLSEEPDVPTRTDCEPRPP